jgi:superfamily II DNA or RNA helicase
MKEAYPSEQALDVILATNMISVGVDVDRLGLMVVMGQPQSSSEYIQSTSRVGRRYPGLVVVLFNSARSRDRSHYESFRAYHSTLYRQVESTSVTPFSSRARARGLHAVVIALARLTIEGFGPNSGASAIADSWEEIETIKRRIIERVRDVDPQEEAHVRHELDEIVDAWRSRVQDTVDIVYSKRGEAHRSLLVAADGREELESGDAFPTLWSLRDVDVQSNLYLVRERDE